MTRGLRRTTPLLLAGAFFSCNQNYPNPFASSQATKTPAATDNMLFVADLYSGTPNGLLEVYSLDTSTATATRLTNCNTPTSSCSNLAASFAPDRVRIAVAQVGKDTNGDGKFTEADGAALLFEDLSRGVSADLTGGSFGARVNGVDWSPADGVIAYSGIGLGGVEDLFSVGTDGTNNADITNSGTIRERHPRFDKTGAVAAFERIDATGKTGVYVFDTTGQEDLVDAGAAGSDPLPGTTYVLGSDADPSFSPDGSQIVFRRLTALSGTEGTWDILTVHDDGSGLVTVATGASFRGAPDWGPNGIAFVEADPSGQNASIVVVAPNGTGRKVVFPVPAGYTVANPRWLPIL